MSILLYAKRIYFAPHTDKFLISLENLHSSGVYTLICMETNRVYIGSSVKLGARFLDYMQPKYLGSRPNSPLIKAIIKYGYINFCFAVLETCKPWEVLEREQYWLDLLMSETRRGPNNPMFGKSPSEETRALISTALKGPHGPLSGIPRPAEVVSLMRVNHPHTKTIYQYASDKITFIAKFDSIRQASQLTGISRGHLTKCLKQGKQVYGKWFFSFTGPS
jgi:hypothetical protein